MREDPGSAVNLFRKQVRGIARVWMGLGCSGSGQGEAQEGGEKRRASRGPGVASCRADAACDCRRAAAWEFGQGARLVALRPLPQRGPRRDSVAGRRGLARGGPRGSRGARQCAGRRDRCTPRRQVGASKTGRGGGSSPSALPLIERSVTSREPIGTQQIPRAPCSVAFARGGSYGEMPEPTRSLHRG